MRAPTHNDRLLAVGTSTQACTKRILATWSRASDGDKVQGARWYNDGELFITSLAAQTGRSIDAVAAVVAHQPCGSRPGMAAICEG